MLRLLVVDDDPMVSQTMQLWLKRQGFDVVTADGAASGLSALRRGDFDLMIVDIFMPDMNGFESVRRFHECAPAVPLIAISGYAFAESLSPAPDFAHGAGAWRRSMLAQTVQAADPADHRRGMPDGERGAPRTRRPIRARMPATRKN